MNPTAHNSVINAQLEKRKTVLTQKQSEYAGDSDTLHNFKKAAHLEGVTPSIALAGMMGKHTVSVYDMIYSEADFPKEVWDEKITDHLNYLLLLQVILCEERVVKSRITSGSLPEPGGETGS